MHNTHTHTHIENQTQTQTDTKSHTKSKPDIYPRDRKITHPVSVKYQGLKIDTQYFIVCLLNDECAGLCECVFATVCVCVGVCVLWVWCFYIYTSLFITLQLDPPSSGPYLFRF